MEQEVVSRVICGLFVKIEATLRGTAPRGSLGCTSVSWEAQICFRTSCWNQLFLLIHGRCEFPAAKITCPLTISPTWAASFCLLHLTFPGTPFSLRNITCAPSLPSFLTLPIPGHCCRQCCQSPSSFLLSLTQIRTLCHSALGNHYEISQGWQSA